MPGPQTKQRGNKPPKSLGRPKGSPNKTTALLKDAILQAADTAGGPGGMAAYLASQARENPGPFMSLLGKVLPLQIAGDPANPLRLITRIELVAPSHDNSED